MFDISDPERPRLLKALDLGANSGPHYIALTSDETRLIISDYFLNEDNFGKVHAEGDHRIHVARITEHDLVQDPRFNMDFNTAFASSPARPHGMAVLDANPELRSAFGMATEQYAVPVETQHTPAGSATTQALRK